MSEHLPQLDPHALRRTPLHALHRELGAKLVPFAGYEMPVQYPAGILAEHRHCRDAAGLFDVSHMGQATLTGTGVAAALETLVPGDIAGLPVGRTRYTLFTGDEGGILDDLMVSNAGDHLFLVVNAACKADDLAHLRQRLGARAEVRELAGRALLALQGPQAASVMARLAPQAAAMKFMSFGSAVIDGIECRLTRSGYTGEDGFEISVPAVAAETIARLLLAQPEVKPIGLGARDSLRLEAGLCLYGHDIDRTTTPVEADLAWAIGKRRRAEGGFPGAAVILRQLAEGPLRRRVGMRLAGAAPAREQTPIVDDGGAALGTVTSGLYGPTVGGPIAMGYVAASSARTGATINLVVRGQPRPATIVPLPFVPHRYHRG
ncbi:MAG: glycine cleavage system aminomethyltransferase GcvT [Alphaproteobacteria bacterium]|nr:glycine cleavage system aminomethyltransferase GcvT [Alphaproteobacteria bacterium]